jgi:transcriptional regulator with XRE-family HTH domain
MSLDLNNIGLSRLNIAVVSNSRRYNIDTLQLRKVLSFNLKARRKKLGISQEKLAEMANLSLQMVNCIEGHRAWVSDKTLIALSNALGMEIFQLFTPRTEDKKQDYRPLPSHWLLKLRQDMKADINANVDMHFERLFNMNMQKK